MRLGAVSLVREREVIGTIPSVRVLTLGVDFEAGVTGGSFTPKRSVALPSHSVRGTFPVRKTGVVIPAHTVAARLPTRQTGASLPAIQAGVGDTDWLDSP